MFEKHYNGLTKAGIKIGCYLYSYANKVADGVLEAKNCLNFIKNKKFDLPIFYDLEDKSTSILGKSNITQLAIDFCKTIQKEGYEVGVYANLNWWKNYINLQTLKQNIPNIKVWLAQWEVSKPTATFSIDYWQYTSSGVLDGIAGRVDMDYMQTITVDNAVENVENSKKSNQEIANEVWQGKWGNGQERVDRLTKAGYDYTEIQKIVNSMNKIDKLSINVGDKVKVLNAIQFTGEPFSVYYDSYDVIEVKGERVVIGRGKTITCAINVNNLKKVS